MRVCIYITYVCSSHTTFNFRDCECICDMNSISAYTCNLLSLIVLTVTPEGNQFNTDLGGILLSSKVKLTTSYFCSIFY
jgi:hypothetical protein